MAPLKPQNAINTALTFCFCLMLQFCVSIQRKIAMAKSEVFEIEFMLCLPFCHVHSINYAGNMMITSPDIGGLGCDGCKVMTDIMVTSTGRQYYCRSKCSLQGEGCSCI